MTKDEALKLALKALEQYAEYEGETRAANEAITAIKEALAQPEQEPVAWAKFSKKGNIIDLLSKPDDDYTPLYTTSPQRKPLTDEEIWVLTSEYNDYDQHGEYFEAVFIGKPTSEQIQKHCHVTKQGAVHILNGGGRVKYEDQWCNLRKEKAAHGIKGEA